MDPGSSCDRWRPNSCSIVGLADICAVCFWSEPNHLLRCALTHRLHTGGATLFCCEVYTMPDTGQDAGLERWASPAVLLVATDLTDLDRLMPFALEQAGETGARLILLHVLAAGTSVTLDAGAMPYYDPAGALEFATKSLEPWCQLAHRHDLACDALVREGNAAQQIASVARQFNADRILLAPGAGASSVSCSSVPWQSKCCARSTSRSLPWDPRLISRWKVTARNASCCTPPHFERPLARAQRLPARSPPARKRSWFCSMCCLPSTRWSATAFLPAWTRRPCTSYTFFPPSPAPVAASPSNPVLCMATLPSRFWPPPRNSRRA